MALTARKSGPRMCGSKTRRIHLWQMAAGLSSRHRQTTIPPMLIVIPGALPALPVAAELASCCPSAPRAARLAAGRRRAHRTLRPRARLHRLRSLAAARRPPARGRPAPGRRPGPLADAGPAPERRAGLAGRTGAPGAGRGPGHAGRSGPDGPARRGKRRAVRHRAAAVRRHRLRGRAAERAPLAPAPARRLAAGHRQPAGRGRPPAERLVEAGRRNPSVAPAAQ